MSTHSASPVPVLVIIGPSGAGKSSIAKELCDRHGFRLEKTVTTRPQRDTYDTDHVFVGETTYQHMLDSGAFFGTLDVFGHHYGLPRFNPQEPTLLLLRAPAIEEFLTMFPDAYIVEIDAPVTILEERLVARGSSDRIDTELLKKESAWGQKLAKLHIDSSRTGVTESADIIAEAIEAA